MEIQKFDMGYFGPSHDNYGIVLFVDAVNEMVHVLDMTNPLERKDVTINASEFVPTRNLIKLSDEAQNKHCSIVKTNRMNHGSNVKSVVIQKKRNYADMLVSAKQTYSKDLQRANPNYLTQRFEILDNLRAISFTDPECLKDLGRLIDGPYDHNNAILTITPVTTTQIYCITLSVIGEEIIIHDASVRYDNSNIFNQLKETTGLGFKTPTFANSGLLGASA